MTVRRIRRVLFLLLAVLIALGSTLGSSSTLFASVHALLFHEWFILLLLGLYALRPVLLVPLGGLHVIAGFVYGGTLGAPVAMLGTVLTALPVYLVGAYLRPSSGIGRWFARRGESAFAETGNLRGMIAASLSPVPADAVSYTAGASGVPFRIFIVGLVIGEVPWVIAYVLLGRSLTTLSVVDSTNLVGLVIALAVLSLLVVARPAYDVLRRRWRDA